MNKLNVIREKCIASNPQIEEDMKQSAIKIAELAGILVSNIRDTGQAHVAELKLEELLKILGRPIRLADIIVTLKSINKMPELRILQPANIWVDGTAYLFWDCFKDDLSKQSEETIDFIYNLLT